MTSSDDLLQKYSHDDIFYRFTFLFDLCDEYVKTLNEVHPTWRLKFDPLILLNVAHSTLDDIWRYKVYHLEDSKKLSDSVKRAAYLSKWIVRLRPIYFDRTHSDFIPEDGIDMRDTSMISNEGFAVFVSLISMANDVKLDVIRLDPDFFANLLYDLHYRELTGDALLNIFDIIKLSAHGGNILMKP